MTADADNRLHRHRSARTGPCATCRPGRAPMGGCRAGTGRSASWLLLFPCWWSLGAGRRPELGPARGPTWRCSRSAPLAMRGMPAAPGTTFVDRKVDARRRAHARPAPALRRTQAAPRADLDGAAEAPWAPPSFSSSTSSRAASRCCSLLLVADLSGDEADHLLAAGRARLRLQLGRAGRLRRRHRHALLGDRRALFRRRRLDHGLRHDLRHAGPARRCRSSACARPRAASRQRPAALAFPLCRAGDRVSGSPDGSARRRSASGLLRAARRRRRAPLLADRVRSSPAIQADCQMRFKSNRLRSAGCCSSPSSSIISIKPDVRVCLH
jgi:hypothetical protein